MARRKYVKENNLVKAINTDSLELQKPLANEYYDINVHNSNMDKIDLGYKQNKNDISNINYELSKTENTKYSTENGIKEFSCKDGYVDNVVIEGETLVNLWGSNGFTLTGQSVINNGLFTCTTVSSRQFSDFWDNNVSILKPNTTYTVVYNITKNTLPQKARAIAITYEHATHPHSFTENIAVEGGVTGLFKQTLKTKDDLSTCKYGLRSFIDNSSMLDGCEVELWIVLLEGDHTDKPISYFEGLKSVGQGDKIEVLTRNSNETKQDKKQILTTLRSLPNGVKDTIEKRGNKYYKIKRCGEVTLNGSENWSLGANANDVTIKPHLLYIDDCKPSCSVNGGMYCDNFKPYNVYEVDNVEEGIHFSSTKTAHIRINKTKATTLEEFKTYLSLNPVTVVYELETPIITELPNFNPQTYEGDTTLLINSGVIQAEADFEVTNSIGSEIEVIKDKVSSLDDNSIEVKDIFYPTLLNGFTPASNKDYNTLKLVKVGNICFLQGVITNPSTTSRGQLICKIPSIYFPIKHTCTPISIIVNGRNYCEGMDIHINGEIKLWAYDNTANNVYYINVFWYC